MEIRVILASASPRRRELLALALENFDVIPANLEEDVYKRQIWGPTGLQ